MAAMAVNPRSQASTATGQCLQRYLAATMDHISIILHTFYFCLFVTSCVLPMHSSNERNTF